MNRMSRSRALTLMAAGAALALGACSKEPEPAAQDTFVPTEDAPGETPEPVSASAAAGADETAPAEIAEIPEAVRGRWGLVPADCTSTLGDAKGLLVVSADQLKFYESVAKLGTIKEAGESRIRATFDYTGEGQSWTQDVVLDARDDGRTLIRRDYGPDAMPGPLKYTRCT